MTIDCTREKINDNLWDMYIDGINRIYKINDIIKTEQLNEEKILSFLHDCDIEILLRNQKMSPEFVKINIIPILNRDTRSHSPISINDVNRWQNYSSDQKI